MGSVYVMSLSGETRGERVGRALMRIASSKSVKSPEEGVYHKPSEMTAER